MEMDRSWRLAQRRRRRRALESLDPAYFGMVMLTGIVSIAFHDLSVGLVAWPLAIFNVACYVLLLGLFAARIGLYPALALVDLKDREQHWGTLTFIVATNAVGVQFLLFFHAVGIATVLWISTAVTTPLLL